MKIKDIKKPGGTEFSFTVVCDAEDKTLLGANGDYQVEPIEFEGGKRVSVIITIRVVDESRPGTPPMNVRAETKEKTGTPTKKSESKPPMAHDTQARANADNQMRFTDETRQEKQTTNGTKTRAPSNEESLSNSAPASSNTKLGYPIDPELGLPIITDDNWAVLLEEMGERALDIKRVASIPDPADYTLAVCNGEIMAYIVVMVNPPDFGYTISLRKLGVQVNIEAAHRKISQLVEARVAYDELYFDSDVQKAKSSQQTKVLVPKQ